MPSASWNFADRLDAVLGLPTIRRSMRCRSNWKSSSDSTPCEERLAVGHPARHLLEVEPVLVADARPPVPLDLVQRVGHPAVAQQHHAELVGGAVLLAGRVVDVRPVLHDVDVVQRVGRPRARRSGPRGGRRARTSRPSTARRSAGSGVRLPLIVEVLAARGRSSPPPTRAGRSRSPPRSATPGSSGSGRRARTRCGKLPMPTPSFSRPPESTSTIAPCSATWIGCSKGSRCTVVPMSTRSVRRRERAERGPRGGQVRVRHHVVLGHEQPVPAGLLGDLRRRRGSPASAARCWRRQAGPGRGTAVRTSFNRLLVGACAGR